MRAYVFAALCTLCSIEPRVVSHGLLLWGITAEWVPTVSLVGNTAEWGPNGVTSGKHCSITVVQWETLQYYSGMGYPDPYHGGPRTRTTMPRVPIPTTHCTAGTNTRTDTPLPAFTRLLLDTVGDLKHPFMGQKRQSAAKLVALTRGLVTN